MKSIFYLSLFFISLQLSAQTTEKPERIPAEYFRIYYVLPGAVGDNVLSKANKGILGLGAAVTLVTLNRFHFIAGYEFTKYEITNRSLAGNLEHTYVNNFYAEVLYKIPVTTTIDVDPKLAIGQIAVGQRNEGKSYGRQYGVSLTPGIMIDYKAFGNFRLFAGINYCLSFPKTNTNNEYKSFFGTLQQVNLIAGIKL